MINVRRIVRVNCPAAVDVTCRLFSRTLSASCVDMWKRLLIGTGLATAALAQNPPSQIEFANLREDVRGLTQRVGELSLRLEQLERENVELKLRAGSLNQSYVTVSQLRDAMAELN